MPCGDLRLLGGTLAFSLLVLAGGWQCTQNTSPPEAPATDTAAADTVASGGILMDSMQVALHRFRDAMPPSPPDTAALRRWTERLGAMGDSLEARDPDSARTLLQLGRRGARTLADSHRVASILNDIGATYYFQSQFDEALLHWETARSTFQALDDPEGVSVSLNNIAIVHARQGRYEKALASYREALSIARRREDQDGIASALNNIGLLFQNQGRYDAALKRYRKSLAIEREQGDRDGIAASLNNIGLILETKGEYEQALDRYRASLKIERAQGDRSGIASTLNNVGLIYKNQGRYDEALDHYRKSLALQRELGDRGGVASALHNIGFMHLQQGQLQDALARFRDALSIERSLEDRSGIAQTLSSIGTLRKRQGHFTAAVDRYEAAQTILNDLGDRSGLASCLHNLGTVYRDQGRYEEALSLLRESLSMRRDLEEPETVATSLNAIGEVLDRMDRPGDALARYRAALRINRDLGRRPAIAQNLENVGTLHLRTGALRAATDTLERAVRLAESVRETATSPAARRSLLSTQIEAYRALATGQIRAGHPEAALRSVEQARARLLAERLMGTTNDDTTFTPPPVNELRQALEPNEAAVVYANAGSRLPLTALVLTSDDVAARRLPEERFLTTLGQDYESRLDRVRRREDASDDVPHSSMDGAPRLGMAVHLYRHHMTDVEGVDAVQKDLARRFYDLLVAPVADATTEATTLVFVPSGPLGHLPFEALRPSSDAFLIEQSQVRYAQSLTVLRHLQNRSYGAPGTADDRRALLALGGASYESSPSGETAPLVAEARGSAPIRTDEQASALLQAARRSLERGESPRPTYAELGYDRWPTLYGTRLEVQKLQRAVTGDVTVLSGKEASEEQLRELSASGELAAYRTVHFATHGFAVPSAPALSALVLSQVGASDSLAARDGYLTMREIADLNLRSDVAVLSGCRTGFGRIFPGQGVVGLSQAFVRAGANATLVSQWRVLDWSTQQFMTSVYRRAQDPNTSFVEAVTLVKRSFIDGEFGDRNAEPLRWAPFVYYGRP